MDNERRPGDWQRRSSRQANTILKDPNEKKWYNQTFWIVVFLFVFWPVGVVLTWISDWPVPVKIIATAIVVAMAVYVGWLYAPLLA